MLLFWPIILFFYAKKLLPILQNIIIYYSNNIQTIFLTRRHKKYKIHFSDCYLEVLLPRYLVLKGFYVVFRKTVEMTLSAPAL